MRLQRPVVGCTSSRFFRHFKLGLAWSASHNGSAEMVRGWGGWDAVGGAAGENMHLGVGGLGGKVRHHPLSYHIISYHMNGFVSQSVS